jgi:broad specificity phosphatase PhoE
LSTVFFFRHGQAGQRDDYDRLSPLGLEQARLLGGYIASQGWRFDRVLCGRLRRQQETAAAAGFDTPEFQDCWNEFDLDVVYAGLAPVLAAEDHEFRREYQEIQRLIQDGDGAIHRQWRSADTQVIKAWIADRHPVEGESWPQFVSRVRGAAKELAVLPPGSCTAVFTSATPISICVAEAFASNNPAHVMWLAGASVNSGITVLKWIGGEPHVSCFNCVPHLPEARLRTFR